MWEDGIYAPGPIKPVVKFKENLAVFTRGKWSYYRVDFIEPMPRSSPMTVEMIAAAGATVLAANGTIAKRVVAILQLNDLEFLHLRWEPLDNVEGVLWEQSGTARFNARNVQARVDQQTHLYDPYLATTTFFILGENRDMNLEVRNPMGYAIPAARFIFWGYRYVLTGLLAPSSEKAALEVGDIEAVRRVYNAVTFVPAEGKAA